MKKGIEYLLFAMLLVLTVFPTNALANSKETADLSAEKTVALATAAETVTPMSLPVVYYVSSKTFEKNLYKVYKKDWTSSWAYAREYAFAEGRSYTSTIGVSVEGVIKDAVKASGQFVNSRTFTNSVTTYIPADKTRLSKLAHYRDYKQYKAVIMYYAGVSGPTTYGTVTVKEPNVNTYNLVRYQ